MRSKHIIFVPLQFLLQYFLASSVTMMQKLIIYNALRINGKLLVSYRSIGQQQFTESLPIIRMLHIFKINEVILKWDFETAN